MSDYLENKSIKAMASQGITVVFDDKEMSPIFLSCIKNDAFYSCMIWVVRCYTSKKITVQIDESLSNLCHIRIQATNGACASKYIRNSHCSWIKAKMAIENLSGSMVRQGDGLVLTLPCQTV